MLTFSQFSESAVAHYFVGKRRFDHKDQADHYAELIGGAVTSYENPEHIGFHHDLGTILQVSCGAGFNARNLAAVKTHDGWHQVNDYLEQGKEAKGLIGPQIEISKMSIERRLYPGIKCGDHAINVLQIGSLPDGSQVESSPKHNNVEMPPKVYTKKEGKWHSPDGKRLEYFHFATEPRSPIQHKLIRLPK